MSERKHILIIKHGALGDMILATGPMKAIRQHHPHAQITLLTAKPYDSLMANCPFVDEIWLDSKPKLWHVGRFRALIRQLRSRRWDWVYDLQTSQRSTSYYRFLHTTYYSGLHPKGSHPHDTPERTRLHTIDRQKQQLAIAGITDVPAPDVDWMVGDISSLPLHGGADASRPEAEEVSWGSTPPTESPSNTYVRGSSTPPQGGNRKWVLLIPGGSAHRPEKRWPAGHYAQLATQLIAHGYTPVLIGTQAEAEILEYIERQVRPSSRTSCQETARSGIQPSITPKPASSESVDSREWSGHRTRRSTERLHSASKPEAPWIPDSSRSCAPFRDDNTTIINLCNQTSFAQIAELARHAAYAIGNDTGPMHIVAAAGCPCTVLFNTTASNPELCAPRGEKVRIEKTDDLTQLSVDFLIKIIIMRNYGR